jgi:hypothetical protein
MIRRHHSFAARGICSLALATGIVSAGCSDEPQATPRVTFESQVVPGAHTQQECPGRTGAWLEIGSFGNPALGRVDPANPESDLLDPVRPVDDGASDQQGTVTISCSVTEKGDGFDVRATAQLTGATGGAVTITGLFRPTGDQPDITVSLTKRGETFSSSKCIARFETQLGHAVAAGRVWANVECPDAEFASAQQICKSSAQFRFENCTQ